MNPLDNFISLAYALTTALAGAAEPPVRDFTLDDHTVYAVPVSGTPGVWPFCWTHSADSARVEPR